MGYSKEVIKNIINEVIDAEINEIKEMHPDAEESEFDLLVKKQHRLAECKALRNRILSAVN